MTENSKIYSHNDDPILIDGFGQQDFIKQVAEIIRECRPPKGIGVNGYWGTGKTSTLMRIYYHISGKHPFIEQLDDTMVDDSVESVIQDHIVPIWFEAWRYQHEALPIVALLNEIREQMGLMKKFRNATGKILGVTLLGSLSAFDEVIKAASGGVFKPGLGKVQAVGEKWEAERHLNPLPGQAIKNILENAIEQALGKKDPNKRLVIFIDDLDRCTPAAGLQLLEGIKVYLNLKNCVIVFGMDQRQIERALISALNLDGEKDHEYNASSQAREYLEKICQDIYHLPQPDKVAKANYFLELLGELGLGEQWKTISVGIELVLLRFDCLPANPRKIKALANRTAVFLGKDQKALFSGAQFHNYAVLIAMTIIYCFHRRVYEQLQKNPAYINEVITWATYPDSSELKDNSTYEPMKNIIPAMGQSGDLPVNPSDSNVFRLHTLFIQFKDMINESHITPFLNR